MLPKISGKARAPSVLFFVDKSRFSGIDIAAIVDGATEVAPMAMVPVSAATSGTRQSLD
ncbi:MAG: hypothetical protein OXI66_05400 [Boseongicola sp.]|nr:hypothetical protein [Boseongicola sp.]MDE0345205.1 hypothetical protein [Boseongicola sp.]